MRRKKPKYEFAPEQRVRGAVVERGLLLPGGILELSFGESTVFVDADVRTGWLPGFTMGINDDFQIGLHAPIRYDSRGGGWTALDPAPHLAAAFVRGDSVELVARAGVLIPASSLAGPYLQLGLPVLLRAAKNLRLDGAIEAELALDGEFQAAVRVPLAATVQLAPWVFTGLGVAPDFALGATDRQGADAHVLLGLTMQSFGLANLELVARFFVENAGAPGSEKFSDGVGTMISASVFPAVY